MATRAKGGMSDSRIRMYFGSDTHRMEQAAKAWMDRWVPPAEQAMGMEVVDGNAGLVESAVHSCRQCREAVQTRGLFGGRKLVWWKSVGFLSETQQGKSDTVKEALRYLTDALGGGVPEDHALVITAPAVDKRFAFYKAMQTFAAIEEFQIPEKQAESREQAQGSIQEWLRHAGMRMSSDALQRFIDLTGGDSLQRAMELEKLALYVHPRKDVTAEDVKAITSGTVEAAVWDLADAVGRRSREQAFRVLARLLGQKESPMGILPSLVGRLRELLVYREALDRGHIRKTGSGRGMQYSWGIVSPEWDALYAKGFDKDPRKGHPYRISILAEQAARFRMDQLVELLSGALEAHEKMVSSPVRQEFFLERLLAGMPG